MKFKKPSILVPHEARKLLGSLSKQALFDMCAGLALLGTNETPEEITAKMCREAGIVLEMRGDRIPTGVREAATRHIDSDGDNDEFDSLNSDLSHIGMHNNPPKG